jgi:hypothetical protein
MAVVVATLGGAPEVIVLYLSRTKRVLLIIRSNLNPRGIILDKIRLHKHVW